jgi:hypothetical protein
MAKIVTRELHHDNKLTQEQRTLIQSNVVYEKRNRDEIINFMGITTEADIAYVDECIKNIDKLQKAWGLYDPQEMGIGF